MRGGGQLIDVSVSTFPCLFMGTKLISYIYPLEYFSKKIYRLLDCKCFEM